MTQRLHLELTTAEHHAVVALIGCVTAATALGLRQALDDLIADGNHRVVVDLSCTEAIDFSGLTVLVAALKSARLAGGDLRIAAASAAVRRALRSTHLHHILHEHPSPDLAFESATPAPGDGLIRNLRRGTPTVP